jgi:hypothetical protein
MFSYPASISVSTECMMCLNCLKSCDNRGVQINLRPPLQELWRQTQPVLSLSLFGVILVGLMGRHQFPALTFWLNIESSLGWSGGFTETVLYLTFLLMALIPFFLSATLSAAASQEKVSENMAHYGIAFIPLALSGHLSHIAHEILHEGIYEFFKYIAKLYYSVTAGIPIGSQEIALSPFIHTSIITFIKVLMITGGLLGSLIALIMIARRLSEKNVFARILPHILVLLLFWIGYIFIFTGSTGALTEAQTASPAPGAVVFTAGASTGPANQPVARGEFSLIIPDIKKASALRLDSISVSNWLRSAQTQPSGQYRLTLYGQVGQAPSGARVQVSLNLGTPQKQFTSPLDTNGYFSGYIYLQQLHQRIPLVLELIDPVRDNVLMTHKVDLY